MPPSRLFPHLIARIAVSGVVASIGCAPLALPRAPAGDAPRRKRGIDADAPFVAFHGRAEQMGDLGEIAATFRVIAVDADPANHKFTRQDLATLRDGGRNIVLGFLNVGFCDRSQASWSTASEGVLPCVGNLGAQIGEREGRPQQVWMDPEDYEYQRLLGEYVAPRLVAAGVDGFLLDGLDLLDHGEENDIPCDKDCVAGGVALLAGLRKEFPNLVFVMQGGLSWLVRGAHVGRTHVVAMVDGVVGEEVYTPTYDPAKEADLLEWKAAGKKAAGDGAFAVFTLDYVNSCKDRAWAESIYRASRSHGFSPAIGTSPISRSRICRWTGL